MSPAADWRPPPAVVDGVLQRAFAAMSEDEFQGKVTDWAKFNGWLPIHHLRSRGTQAGWPDLVLLRPPEAIFAELKKETGKPSADQNAVMAMLRACGMEVYLWRPSDWDAIEARLRRRITPR